MLNNCLCKHFFLFHKQCKCLLNVNLIFSCFKQSPLNFTVVLVPTKFNKELRILLDVVGGLILSSDKPLDFHDKMLLSLALTVLKYLLAA